MKSHGWIYVIEGAGDDNDGREVVFHVPGYARERYTLANGRIVWARYLRAVQS